MRSFLSHSSKDKKAYVEIVARILGRENCVYDDLTFEEGMKNFDEILKGLDQTDLFVLFLSDAALESDWVNIEILNANTQLNKGYIKKFFPIIIDKSIEHTDPRIPQWMREYNLKYVSRPTVAARRIRQRLKEISWDFHPKNKAKQRIFAGRNDLIDQFEARIDDLDKITPTCIIASGLPDVGRRTLIRKAFVKANLVDETYEFPMIALGAQDSIEDFILELNDLGLSGEIDIKNLLVRTIEEKIDIAKEIIQQIQEVRERIVIVDNGCIVTHERKVTSWFDAIIQGVSARRTITFAVVSRYRVKPVSLRGRPSFFSLEVSELDKKERGWLLKRYSEFEGLALSSSELNWFLSILNGFPEQVFYAVDLIKDEGVESAKSHSHDIVGFNSERAGQVIQKYEHNQDALAFLSLLSGFEFISLELISEVTGSNPIQIQLLEEFISSAICELIGANKEYVRLNDTIRDFVQRQRIGISEFFKKKLSQHVTSFLNTYRNEEKDVSDYLFSLKEAIIRGDEIDESFLIPSHFVKTMKDLYDKHDRYEDVIKLADRILVNSDYMDDRVKRNIRYYLCLALARKKSERFILEVKHIDGPEHNFLMGFYYRLGGKYKEAVERLEKALDDHPNFSRAKRDLVQVYLSLGEFERAKELAEENYSDNKNNPYHIQAYFHCILMSSKQFENENLLESLVEDLSKINSDMAREMYLRSKAQFLAFNQGDFEEAIKIINISIGTYNSPYSKFAKFEICEKFSNLDGMKEALTQIEATIDAKSYFYPFVKRYKCLHILHEIGKDAAMKYLHSSLRGYPISAFERMRRKIDTFDH